MCQRGFAASQGLVNQLSQTLIVNRARPAGTYFVIQPVDAMLQEPDAPLAHRNVRELKTLGICAVGLPAAAASTMRARVTSAAEIERERTIEVSCARSSLLNTSSAFGRPMCMLGISRSVDTSMLCEYRLVNNRSEH
jgi:hypothetical protein